MVMTSGISLKRRVTLSWWLFPRELGLREKYFYGLRSVFRINSRFSGAITLVSYKESADAISVCINLHLR